MNKLKLRTMLEQFYIEDIGDGDLSSTYLFPATTIGEIKLVAKMDGVFCGVDVIEQCAIVLDATTVVTIHVQDGETVQHGTVLATLQGSIASLLQTERVLLNLIQRMSGIATATQKVVRKIAHTPTKVCDTRKTMPGLRMLDKFAVRAGGGMNHRFGLYDAVMLKDNHIDFVGSLKQAVKTVRDNVGHTVKIEVEVETHEAMLEAIEAQADIIMFDNCTPEEIAQWSKEVPPHIITEASGMITEETIVDYAEAGVEYISLGALTHSVPAFDISAVVTINEQ